MHAQGENYVIFCFLDVANAFLYGKISNITLSQHALHKTIAIFVSGFTKAKANTWQVIITLGLQQLLQESNFFQKSHQYEWLHLPELRTGSYGSDTLWIV